MIRLGLLVVSLLTLSLFPSAGAETPRAQHVFIVSFDQGAPRIIEKADMPVFKSMQAEGANGIDAYTIVPSLTLPSHVSMLTGLGIQKHQVDWNAWIPEKGTVKFPTVFSLAKAKGLVTAMIVGKEKFKHLNIEGSTDAFIIAADTAQVGQAFVEQVAKLKPNLCFIHFAEPDSAGHQFGVGSPQQMQALADCDRVLGIIRDAAVKAGMGDSLVFILTADHGGHDTKDKEGRTFGTHGSSTPDDVLIPWIAWGKGVRKGATISDSIVTYDTAATALWLLGVPVPKEFWGKPVTAAFE